MCGIAGLIDLTGHRPLSRDMLESMSDSMIHRGPDDSGSLLRPGLGLAHRRLSIIGLEDGRQPLASEDGAVISIGNGELFDYERVRADLQRRGHRFATHSDLENVVHLWEDHGEAMWTQLRGQFAIAVWDEREQRLVIGRDRFGICPVFWTIRDGWLLFASEIKSLLASGMVPAAADWRGIEQIFTCMSVPGPATCFEGVQTLLPGHYLSIQRDPDGTAKVEDRTYWEIDYPDRGHENSSLSDSAILDEFEHLMVQSVDRRLKADVPVVGCLSGGVDSTIVVAMANHVLGRPIKTFTISVDDPNLDETSDVAQSAQHMGSESVVLRCRNADILEQYPTLIRAAEAPVIDTASAAVLKLSQLIRQHGFKVALTGQGADELLAGYIWFKSNRLFQKLNFLPGLDLTNMARKLYTKFTTPNYPWSDIENHVHAVGGQYNAAFDAFGRVFTPRFELYSQQMRDRALSYSSFSHMGLNRDRMAKWDPLNQGLYLTSRTLLSGMLLSSKGDRACMNASVEMRHPFLDEDLFDFCAKLPAHWKLRRLQDKFLLRAVADKWLPKAMSRRRKAMFLTPWESLCPSNEQEGSAPTYVEELLSEDSIRRAGYFDPAAVSRWRRDVRQLRKGSLLRTSFEMSLVGVVSTQLWHHSFIDGNLASLPSLAGTFSSVIPQPIVLRSALEPSPLAAN
ncbi:MAG: asparagine synthase (glutamine-hydrolyzing) [Planctomycetes bacterium]|nr:asparagine synthase (glutamine-hydrolyzing) [Planctomycetota bacterium]